MKLTVTGTKTEVIPVEMDIEVNQIFAQIKNLAFRKFFNKCIVEAVQCRIDDNSLVENMEYRTSHSWYDDVVRVKELTQEQKDLFNAFKLIGEHLKEMV